MKHWKLIIAISLTTSCGQLGIQGQVNSRLATLEANHSGQITETDLTNHIQSKLNDLHLLQLGAYEDLEHFDSSLGSQWKGLTSSVPYSKLVAAKIRIDEIQNEIYGLQSELFEMAQDEQVPLDLRVKSILSLQHTLPLKTQTQGSWEFTLWSVHQHNKNLAKKLILAQGHTQENELQNALEKVYLTIRAQHGAFDEGLPVFEDWKSVIRKEQSALKNSEDVDRISKSVEHLAHEIRFEFQKLSKSNEMNDETQLRPSTEAMGNISGDEFPGKVWSLTFNAGPVVGLTKKTVNQLTFFGQKGTFFQAAQMVKKNPHSARYVKTSGMEIASQANLRLSVGNLSPEEREEQIQDATTELSSFHSDTTIRFYRLTHVTGISQRDIRARIANLGLIHAFWNVDALDWQIQPPSDISQRTIKQIESTKNNSGIVMFTEGQKLSLTASEEVMSYLKRKNNRVCSLGEIVSQMNSKLAVCPVKVNLTSN